MPRPTATFAEIVGRLHYKDKIDDVKLKKAKNAGIITEAQEIKFKLKKEKKNS